jgi:protein O-GlcNAc transferase
MAPRSMRSCGSRCARRRNSAAPVTGPAPAAQPRAADMDVLRALERRGEMRALLDQGLPLLERFPQAVPLLQMLGIAHARLAEPTAGAVLFARIVAIEPDNAAGHVNLGNTLRDLGRRDAAVRSFERAIAIDPGIAQAHFNLGNTLRDLGHNAEALVCFERAIDLRPGYVAAHGHRGDALVTLGRPQEAVACYRRAIALEPDNPRHPNNMGMALRLLGRYPEAIEAFSAALAGDPGHAAARARRAYLRARICDWDAMAEDATLLPVLGIDGPVVPPFMMLVLEDAPVRHRVRAERYAASSFPDPGGVTIEAVRPASSGDRLRVGYFSADFHDHATMHLMARLFEAHDRAAFDIHAFSYGPDSDDAMRRRLIGAVEHFHEVRTLDDRAIAALARREGIDVAVDLKGHTTDSRSGLFTHRAAPVQIAYLGYPGTMGAGFIDYIVADRIVIPPDRRGFYTEAPIWLPHSYQANDDRRPIADRVMTRAEFGLPEQGFVFASFNASYKITPDLFAIWMRLLHRVGDSVLWLLGGDADAAVHLRSHARRHGIDPARLVFAAKLPVAEHLARQRLADLFLDSFVCNAHTTASDALWAGLPILTKAGEGFAARVCASLLRAVGLPELVTDTAADYEALAFALATDRAALAAIRAKLADQRGTAPLFDSVAFTRHIEDGYRQAHARHRAGLPPAPIEILP